AMARSLASAASSWINRSDWSVNTARIGEAINRYIADTSAALSATNASRRTIDLRWMENIITSFSCGPVEATDARDQGKTFLPRYWSKADRGIQVRVFEERRTFEYGHQTCSAARKSSHRDCVVLQPPFCDPGVVREKTAAFPQQHDRAGRSAPLLQCLQC